MINKVLISPPRAPNGLPYGNSTALNRKLYATFNGYQWRFSRECPGLITTVLMCNEMFEGEFRQGANRALAIKGLTPEEAQAMGAEETGFELRNTLPPSAVPTGHLQASAPSEGPGLSQIELNSSAGDIRMTPIAAHSHQTYTSPQNGPPAPMPRDAVEVPVPSPQATTSLLQAPNPSGGAMQE